MDLIEPSWFEVLLRNSHEQNEIVKVLSVEVMPATKVGDNYMSEIKRIKMEVVLKSGKKTRKSIIAKGLPQTEFHRGILKEMSIFRRESTMYRDVTPKMEDILTEFSDYTEPMWPHMMFYRSNDLIIFNDLTENGYKMGNRKEGLNMEHCLLVMRSLAKFHATSVILKERELLPIEMFKDHVFKTTAATVNMKTFYDQSLKDQIEKIEKNWEAEWQPIAVKLKENVLPKVYDLVMKDLVYDETKFMVMNHGDCWVNNMMFRYGVDDVTPITVKFVDLQMVFYNSPSYDLQYFLSTSLDLEVRKNSVEELIRVYHETLVKQLELYSYKGEIWTYDQLIDDFKEKDIFGLMTAVCLLPYVYREETEEDFPEIEKMIKDIQNDMKATLPKCDHPQFISVMKLLLSRADNNKSI